MECKGVRAILAVAAILVLLAGQSSAWQTTPAQCYDECYNACLGYDKPEEYCTVTCHEQCGDRRSAAKVDIGCSFACAKSSCGQLAAEGNEMGACLSACSKSCTKVRKSL